MSLPIPRPRAAAAAPAPPPALDQIAAAGVALHHALEQAVIRCRLTGASWADIGRALGITKQAAHERFRSLDCGTVTLMREGGRCFWHADALGEELRPADPRQALHAGAALHRIATRTIEHTA